MNGRFDPSTEDLDAAVRQAAGLRFGIPFPTATRQCTLALGMFGLFSLLLLLPSRGSAKDASERVLDLAGGKLQVKVDEGWKRKTPRVKIIEYEFSVDPQEGDARPGRVTMMPASGSVDENVARWKGQFVSSGEGSKVRIKIDQKKIAGLDVRRIDLSGTYKDRPGGPFSPAAERPDYRMLSAIIETKQRENYFIKFVGPRKTVTQHEKAFDAMLESLDRK